jgi:cathepsin A (carboxypeptidase C)
VVGGETKAYGGLTFLRIYDAGHMVPMDQPQVAEDMLSEFLHSGKISGSKALRF